MRSRNQKMSLDGRRTVTCIRCDGTGKVWKPMLKREGTCPDCNGTGSVYKKN
mgnify:CR=1 FL=1